MARCRKRIGIQALYRRPNTSKPAPGHKVYPSLLRKLAVTRPNQVWAMDITYIPMARGLVYLVAVLDWFSRKVLAWRRSTTLETGPCIEALKEAMRHHSKPEIMNTDQGSQFTSIHFIKALKDADIQISMDGKGAWRDNVFVERLWRTINYGEVYLRAYDSMSEARESLRRLQHAETAFIAGRADARSGILQPVVTNPGGGIIEREIQLRNAPKLFKRTEPPLWPRWSSCWPVICAVRAADPA